MSAKADGKGLRFNDGKIRFDLIPADVMLQVAKVFTHGASKYAERNWERGMKFSICRGSKERHWNARLRGEVLDSESKLHHLAHDIVNTMFLLAYELRGQGTLDDLEPFLSPPYRYVLYGNDGSAHPIEGDPSKSTWVHPSGGAITIERKLYDVDRYTTKPKKKRRK